MSLEAVCSTLVVRFLDICGKLLSASVNLRCSEFSAYWHSTSNFAGSDQILHPLRIPRRRFSLSQAPCCGKWNGGCSVRVYHCLMVKTIIGHPIYANGVDAVPAPKTKGLGRRQKPELLSHAFRPNFPPFFGLGF